MAYTGKLIEICRSSDDVFILFPTWLIAAESYKVTPNQRLESSAYRSADGSLHRTTVSHTVTKIEFNTPIMTNSEFARVREVLAVANLNNPSENIERKCLLRYYDPETDSYKTGGFYMPDVDYDILRVDNTKNIVWYGPIRFAFIEY